MSDVRDEVLVRRLADLAETGPRDTGLVTPAETWERGLRYRRRRRRGTAVVVAATVLALGGLLSLVEVQRPDPAPVAPQVEGALPDRTWEPSPWLPGTDDLGPPGPLAMVIEADRGGWLGGHRGLVGVSAATGEYRFLDLPDRAAGYDEFGLSADGRWIAYRTTGPTPRSPNTADGQQDPVVGAAVYDTGTGEVVRLPLASRHGVSPHELLWVGEHVVLAYSAYRAGDDGPLNRRSSSMSRPTLAWSPGTGTTRELPADVWTLDGWPAAGDLLVGSGGEVLSPLDIADGASYRSVRLDEEVSSRLVVDPTGRRIAAISGRGDRNVHGLHSPNAIVVSTGTLAEAGDARVRMEPVPGPGLASDVLGWVDGRRLAVISVSGTNGTFFGDTVALVDVSSGAREPIVDLAQNLGNGAGQWVATDLLGQPTRAGVEPPRPWDPRVTAGLGVLLLGSGVGAVVWWRRRVEP